MCVCACVPQDVRGGQRTTWGIGLLHSVRPGDLTQAIGPGGRHLSLLSHLTGRGFLYANYSLAARISTPLASFPSHLTPLECL